MSIALSLNHQSTGLPCYKPTSSQVDGRIRRSEFINQKFLYTVSIDSSDGFQLCPADGCQIGKRPEQLETSEKFQITEPLPDDRREAYEKLS